MMKKVILKMADPMPGGCKQPEPVVIEISGKISELTHDPSAIEFKSLDDVKIIFDQEAKKLVDALLLSLPQGMIEPVTIKLLEHRVSLFHIIEYAKKNKADVDMLNALETVRDLPEFKDLWSGTKHMVEKAIEKARG